MLHLHVVWQVIVNSEGVVADITTEMFSIAGFSAVVLPQMLFGLEDLFTENALSRVLLFLSAGWPRSTMLVGHMLLLIVTATESDATHVAVEHSLLLCFTFLWTGR